MVKTPTLTPFYRASSQSESPTLSNLLCDWPPTKDVPKSDKFFSTSTLAFI